MELFDEIYGVYYSAVSHVLASTPLTKPQLRRLLCQELSVEGAQEVEDKLLDGTWPLLQEKGGKYYSALHYPVSQPLSHLEAAYLMTLANDPHSQLFLSDEQLAGLRQALGDQAPLYSTKDFDRYDRFSDGDEVTDEYAASFRCILDALSEDVWLDFDYMSRRGQLLHFYCKPITLEYSGKDDRFRLHSVDKNGEYLTQNMASIHHVRLVDPPECFVPLREQTPPICEEPVVVRVSSERSALSRFMLEFSYLQKRSELSEDGRSATVRLWYPKADETEILIRLLGFGPVIRVISPPAFVERMKGRVRRQKELLEGGQDISGTADNQ